MITRINSFILFSILFIIPACGPKKTKNFSGSLSGNTVSLLNDDSVVSVKKSKKVNHQESYFLDVPLPLGAVKKEHKKVTGDMACYEVAMADAKVADFYTKQMKRYDWQHVHSFMASEQLLLFEKPNKMCAISLRPNKKITDIVIFVSLSS